MSILVAYATRHGSTKGIAERIAERLRRGWIGCGGKAGQGHPRSGGIRRLRRGRRRLHVPLDEGGLVIHAPIPRRPVERPLWLFSSGPLGTETTDRRAGTSSRRASPGNSRRSAPCSTHETCGSSSAHSMRVARRSGSRSGFVMMMPAARAAFPQGDFRDWPRIEAWADGIASELKTAAAASR